MDITVNSFSENEDHVIYIRLRPYNDIDITVAVLCDGMGSMTNGRISAVAAAESFISAIVGKVIHQYDKNKNDFSILNYRDRIISSVAASIRYANTAVCEVATPGFGSGTTISAAVVADDFLVTANIGDSPIYYYDGNANECFLEISEGIIQIHTIEKIHKNDRIILMSYSASDKYSPADLKNILSGSDQPNDILSKILSGTYNNDDKSIVIMQIS